MTSKPPWASSLDRCSLDTLQYFLSTSGELEGAGADTKSALRPHTPSRNLYRNAVADLFVTAIDVPDCGQNNKKYTQHMVLEHLNIHIQK